MRVRTLVKAALRCSVVLAAAASLYSPGRVVVSQQNFPQPNRKPACTIFCGDNTMNYVVLAKPPACWGGPLPADNAGGALDGVPPGDKAAICDSLKATQGDRASCPAYKALMRACGGSGGGGKGSDRCDEPSLPWFDRGAACSDVQAPLVATQGDLVRVSVCGYSVFTGKNPIPGDKLALGAYLTIIRSEVQAQIGSKVCCDSIRTAARTGTPCDPSRDIDCDGIPNDTDVTRNPEGTYSMPRIDIYTLPKDGPVDRFPPGLDPDDPDFLPNTTARDAKGVGPCACKWQLVKGTLACSPDGRADHVYTAAWRCPSNGKEVFTTKRAKATQPCKEYKDSGVSLLREWMQEAMSFEEMIGYFL
ncbi:MAG: hypothetical protein ACK4S4_11090 [Pyrinomonadaceae bacterium]